MYNIYFLIYLWSFGAMVNWSVFMGVVVDCVQSQYGVILFPRTSFIFFGKKR